MIITKTSPYKKRLVLLATIAITAILSACSARGQRFDPRLLDAAESNSAIVIYRASHFLGVLNTVDFLIDNEPMGQLKNGGWIGITALPGRHAIDIDKGIVENSISGRHPLRLETLPGHSYFIRYERHAYAVGATVASHDRLYIVPEEQALKELEDLHESK